MTTVKYILEDGSEVLIEADVGQNLMQLALDNNLDGIVSEKLKEVTEL